MKKLLLLLVPLTLLSGCAVNPYPVTTSQEYIYSNGAPATIIYERNRPHYYPVPVYRNHPVHPQHRDWKEHKKHDKEVHKEHKRHDKEHRKHDRHDDKR